MPDFAPVVAPGEPTATRHSEYATAPCAAEIGVAHNLGTPVLNRDLARSCAPEVQPGMPQPGFSQIPDRDSAKTKNDSLTIIPNDRPLVSVPALASQPGASFGRGSTPTGSPLDKVVPVLIAPECAMDRFVAANTRPPEVGVLPSELRRDIFEALLR